VRFRADAIPGYKTAWMLWPDDGNNEANGEIDFPERNLNSPNVMAFMHRRDSATSTDQAWFRAEFDNTEWHTAVTEWSPNLVTFILDGKELGHTTTRVPDNPMHWVLQTEVALTTHAKPPASARGNVKIDWVAAWAYAPNNVSSSALDGDPPAVQLGGVSDGQTVSGAVTLAATSPASSGIDQAKWFVDGEQVAWDGTEPTFSEAWDSRSVANGSHQIFAKARDNDGNWGTSESITVKVDN
jgi:hypothetical protein